MIVLKTARELALMKEAGFIAAQALKLAGEAVEPGITTGEIDRLVHDFIVRQGAYPTFLKYNGYPASVCVSVNDEVIHGIPAKDRVIAHGDLVSIDLGATLNGYIGDTAATFAAGDISPEAKRLSDTTRESLYEGIKAAVAGGRTGGIGAAISQYCEGRGYSVVREYTGHGVGTNLHEDPSLPNYGLPGSGARLTPGMTLAIEPMINLGAARVYRMQDGWTVKTADGNLSAHFEHTVAITASGPVILTKL